MAYKIVMTSRELVDKLIHIARDLDTFYKAKYPYNLGYRHADGRYSWDCWNLMPKSLVWGWHESDVIGYYAAPNAATGLGDWGGAKIMTCCADISTDFSDAKMTAGEYMLSTDNGHAGAYIGEFIINGHCYNTVECTPKWGNKVIFTYCSQNGGRYKYKGGEKASVGWAKHGKLPWIDYTVQPEPPTPPDPPASPIIYTVVRGDALYKIANKFGVTIADLVKWNNISNPNLIYVGQKLIVGYNSPTPVPPEPEKVYYTVVRGDNLTKIAAKFGTTVNQLVAWNNLKNKNLILVGQVLRVK